MKHFLTNFLKDFIKDDFILEGFGYGPSFNRSLGIKDFFIDFIKDLIKGEFMFEGYGSYFNCSIGINNFLTDLMKDFMKDEFMFEGFGYLPSFNYKLVKFFFDFYRYQAFEIVFDDSQYLSKYSFSTNRYKSGSFIYTNGKYYYSYDFDCFVYHDFDKEDFNNIRGFFLYSYDIILLYLFLFLFFFRQIFLNILYIYYSRPIDSSLNLDQIIYSFCIFFLFLFFDSDNRKSLLTIQKLILLLFFIKYLFIVRSSTNFSHLISYKFSFGYGSLRLKYLRVTRYKYDNYINQGYVESYILIQIFQKNDNFNELKVKEKKRRKIFNYNTGRLVASTRSSVPTQSQWFLIINNSHRSVYLDNQSCIPDNELDLDNFLIFTNDNVAGSRFRSTFERINTSYEMISHYYNNSWFNSWERVYIRNCCTQNYLEYKKKLQDLFSFVYRCCELIVFSPIILFFLLIWFTFLLIFLLILLIMIVPVPIEFM